MNHTRRELGILLPAIVAAAAEAQPQPPLPSKTYAFDSLPVKKNPTTHGESRQVFNGTTHEGVSIDTHITLLAAGQMPHPPHHHEWEEIIFIQTGTLEFTINGNTSRVGPGSITYIASNEEHGSKNVGDAPSQYFVLAIGRRGRT
jgi:quercetin dioxygenase-like cupin family protein